MIAHEWNHDEEKQKREADLNRLRQTEGWKKLTDRQKRIIELSLYVQQRAERGTSLGSARAISVHDDGVSINPGDPDMDSGYIKSDYGESQGLVGGMWCFSAVKYLESQDESNDSFFQVDYFKDQGWNEFVRNIDSVGFPCVGFSKRVRSTETGEALRPRHAFVVLGRDISGRYVVWEKQDPNMPFRILDLEGVYKKYHDENGDMGSDWGFRSLRGTK